IVQHSTNPFDRYPVLQGEPPAGAQGAVSLRHTPRGVGAVEGEHREHDIKGGGAEGQTVHVALKDVRRAAPGGNHRHAVGEVHCGDEAAAWGSDAGCQPCACAEVEHGVARTEPGGVDETLDEREEGRLDVCRIALRRLLKVGQQPAPKVRPHAAAPGSLTAAHFDQRGAAVDHVERHAVDHDAAVLVDVLALRDGVVLRAGRAFQVAEVQV